jgi:hypothetical protein
MSNSIQAWMERATSAPGVLACGARLADRSFVAKSCREEFPEPRVFQALRDLSEAAYALQQNRVAAERLRWTFEHGQIRCLIQPGGFMVAVLVSRETADSPEIEQLLSDFALAVS